MMAYALQLFLVATDILWQNITDTYFKQMDQVDTGLGHMWSWILCIHPFFCDDFCRHRDEKCRNRLCGCLFAKHSHCVCCQRKIRFQPAYCELSDRIEIQLPVIYIKTGFQAKTSFPVLRTKVILCSCERRVSALYISWLSCFFLLEWNLDPFAAFIQCRCQKPKSSECWPHKFFGEFLLKAMFLQHSENAVQFWKRSSQNLE